MSGKRSRQGDSSNHVSLPVKYGKEVCGASDMRKPPKCLKASVDEGAKEQLRNNTILKPTADESVSGGIGSFLKHCYYCKKMIHQGKDVFMYRDLCAFCTEECRDRQIELDEKSQRQSAESSGVIQEQEVNNMMNGSF